MRLTSREFRAIPSGFQYWHGGPVRGAYGFALWQVVADLALTIAALDLKLVQLLRGAMASNNCCGTSASGLGPAPSCIERRFRVEPETEILPRKRVEPAPLIEPRQIIRPVDRFEPQNVDPVLAPVPTECYRPATKSPIEPPWKVLPWEQPMDCKVEPKVKMVVRPPDIVHKGSLIDFFI